MTSGSQGTPKLRGSTPSIPRQRHVMNPTQLCGNPNGLLFPAKTEKNFRHDGADQGHAVVVQQFVERLFFLRMRAVEKRYPDACIDQNKVSHRNHWLSFQRPRGRASCRSSRHGPKAP